MKDNEKKLTLTSFDDIFKNDETRREESAERVQLISVDLMDDFPNHPFKILDDCYSSERMSKNKKMGKLLKTREMPGYQGL